jgi:hypothetical protein
MKYIESEEDGEEQISLGHQSNNIKDEPITTDIPNQSFKSNSFINHPNIPRNCLTVSSIIKHSKKIHRRKLIKTLDKRIVKRKLKSRVPKNGILSVSRSECHVQNILDTFSSSK